MRSSSTFNSSSGLASPDNSFASALGVLFLKISSYLMLYPFLSSSMINFDAIREVPPISKKLSSAPTVSIFSIVENIAQISCSSLVFGAT